MIGGGRFEIQILIYNIFIGIHTAIHDNESFRDFSDVTQLDPLPGGDFFVFV